MLNVFINYSKGHAKEFFSEPKSAILGIFLRAVNALGPLLVWKAFFHIENSIGGQSFSSISLIMGLACTTLGINAWLFDGIADMAYLIREDKISGFFFQPKSPWLLISLSRQDWNGIGYILSGAVFFYLAQVTLANIPKICLLLLFMQLFYLGFFMILQCIGFYLKSLYRFGSYVDSMITAFTQFPEKFFGKFLKVILYSLIPAGFMAYWPAELVHQFSMQSFGLFAVICALVFGLSFYFLNAGFSYYAKNQSH